VNIKDIPSIPDRLRYAFDNTMSKGMIALIGLLGVLSTLVVGISPEGGEQFNFTEAIWQSLMRTLDAGTMDDDTGWGFRITMSRIVIMGDVGPDYCAG
jgi:hypothetical protein